VQQGSHSEFDGRPGGSTCQCASEFMRKTVWRPATFAELKCLVEHSLGSNYADLLPAVRLVDIAVPTFVQTLWIEALRTKIRRLRPQDTAGKQQSKVAHYATT